MNVTTEINKILGIRDSYKAPDRIYDILTSNIDERNAVFKQFLELFKNDVSYDWFHEYFQEEHAQRKKLGQDFTPNSVSDLLVKMTTTVNKHGSTYEPTAGTGGILIRKWQHDRMQTNPFDYRPSDYMYNAEELSDRAIPYLLFNLIIRGMNAVVIQCDVLTRDCYGIFFVQNDKDDFLGFSSLNVLEYKKQFEKEFRVKYVEEKYKPLTQSEYVPARLADPKRFNKEREEDKDTFTLLKTLFVQGNAKE